MNYISFYKKIKQPIAKLGLLCGILIPFLSGCKNDPPDFNNPDNYKITSSTGGGKTDITPGEYYVKGTLNGQAINWLESATADGFLTGSSTDPQTDNGIVTTGISGLLSGMGTNTQAFSIQFETLNYATTANKTSVFAAFFTTGAWVYNASPERLAGKRVSVNYSVADPVTNKSKSYSSRSGDQTGNTFTVNTITQIAAKPGEDASAKIKMTFSCKLYPLDGVGAALTFTNVEAVLNIANTL